MRESITSRLPLYLVTAACVLRASIVSAEDKRKLDFHGSTMTANMEELQEARKHMRDSETLPAKSMLDAQIEWLKVQKSTTSGKSDMERVHQMFDRIIEAHPKHAQAYLMRATVDRTVFEKFKDKSAHARALHDYELYARLKAGSKADPSLPGVLLTLGAMCAEAGDLKKARETLNQVVATWPNSTNSKNAELIMSTFDTNPVRHK